ncbi:MAG: type III polyketide synthase [Planctomycetota bacterium]
MSQNEALELLVQTVGLKGDALRQAKAIYGRSGIERRFSVLCNEHGEQAFYQSPVSKAAHTPGTGERMHVYARHAPELAARAAREALRSSGCAGEDITHIVTASCTGFFAPGLDYELINRLNLSPEVQRVHLGFMGCHAAINALGVAHSIVRSQGQRDAGRANLSARAKSRKPRVLVVCVELSSLHLPASNDPEQVVVSALFADGAGACVVEPDDSDAEVAVTSHELVSTGSIILPDSRSAMGWHVGDSGFRMVLGESIPRLIERHLSEWLSPWLHSTLNLHPQDRVEPRELAWCVHPGGPKVLEATRDAMGLVDDAIRYSRSILRQNGNMSSASILFILQHMIESGVRGPAVMLAFGPGIAVEAGLVRLGGHNSCRPDGG